MKSIVIFNIVFNLDNSTYVVDERLLEIIEKKINETISKTDEISQIIKSLEALSTKTNSFAYGVVIGRLYNSFYYQCRRILQRNPTEQEFSEFLQILKQRQNDFLDNFGK